MHPRDEAIVRSYEAGATLAAIAADFGLSTAGVAKVLDKASVKRRRKGPPIKLAGKWAVSRKRRLKA